MTLRVIVTLLRLVASSSTRRSLPFPLPGLGLAYLLGVPVGQLCLAALGALSSPREDLGDLLLGLLRLPGAALAGAAATFALATPSFLMTCCLVVVIVASSNVRSSPAIAATTMAVLAPTHYALLYARYFADRVPIGRYLEGYVLEPSQVALVPSLLCVGAAYLLLDPPTRWLTRP